VLSYIDRKRRTTILDSFYKAFQFFRVGSNLWKTVFTYLTVSHTEEGYTLRLCRNV